MQERQAEDLVSDLEKGEIVEIKPEYLKKRHKKGTFTPADLVGIGWPNRFQILQTGETPDGKPTLSLDPCCLWMVDKTEKKDFLCGSHHTERFQAVREPRKDPSSSDNLTVRTALGKLFQVDYSDDKDEPCLEIQVGEGDPLKLGGKMAKLIGEKFRNAGLL